LIKKESSKLLTAICDFIYPLNLLEIYIRFIAENPFLSCLSEMQLELSLDKFVDFFYTNPFRETELNGYCYLEIGMFFANMLPFTINYIAREWK